MITKNIDFLASFSETLANQITNTKESIEINSDVISTKVKVNGSAWISDLEKFYIQVEEQFSYVDRVRFLRPVVSPRHCTPNQVLADMIDSEDILSLPALKILHSYNADANSSKKTELARSCILLGSLSLLKIDSLLAKLPHISTLILVEDDPVQLAIALHFADFKGIVEQLRCQGVGFELIYQPGVDNLGPCVLENLGKRYPCALIGFHIIKSPRLSPSLIKLYSWCHASDGLLDQAKGFIGNDTDEFNQVIHAVWNAVACNNPYLLKRDVIPDDFPITLVASGPSLDNQLAWLREEHHRLVIVAAASSLGTLLRNKIHVDAVVFLEMGSVVYKDLCDLLIEGFDLSGISLFAASTVDPRISGLFKETIFFHRPLSSAFCIFPNEDYAILPQAGPQAANAALEVVMQLGSRRVLLLGCDFAAVNPLMPRSTEAIGISERELSLPVPGNQGRTVFSSAELSTTRQFFENALRLYSPQAVSLGEGSLIENVIAYPQSTYREVADQHVASSESFKKYITSLPRRTVSRQELIHILESAKEYSGTRYDEAYQTFLGVCLWNQQMSVAYASFLTWDDHNMPSYQKLVHRLSRFPLFMAAMPLHDAASSDQWSVLLEDWHESLLFINTMTSSLLDFLILLASSSLIPSIDSSWVKRYLASKV